MENKSQNGLPHGTMHFVMKDLEKTIDDSRTIGPSPVYSQCGTPNCYVGCEMIKRFNKTVIQEQKGCSSRTKGTKDQLLIDKMMMRRAARLTQLCAGQAIRKNLIHFDSVPHSWILECLKIYNISNNISRSIENSMKHWKEDINVTFGLSKCAKTILEKWKLSAQTKEIIVFVGNNQGPRNWRCI